MTSWRDTGSDDAESDIAFVSYRQIMKDEGEFNFTFTIATFNENAGAEGQSQCITLINGDENTAITCWLTQHPEALYPQSVTDGVRLGRALDRAFKGETAQETIDKASEAGGTLKVTKNQVEGRDYWAWLWEVTPL